MSVDNFYAGVPLRAPGGQPIGALSLFDTKPRQFNQRDLRHLLAYADEIMEEFARGSVSERSAIVVVN